MGISVELSLYPLHESYKNIILNFVDQLRTHEHLSIKTNSMSSQIFGDYEVVMSILQKELKQVFEQPEMVVAVMKVVGKNLEA
ncbi:MAG: YkoF family thiamine/hydroxymethylpyrimidine-binding protein [Bacteroidota bacterium]